MTRPEKYLIYFGYFGTKFRGVYNHRQWIGKCVNDNTIYSAINNALHKIDPHTKYKNLIFSSRTDSGVHALKSTAHFDINFSCGYGQSDVTKRSHYLTLALNREFVQNKQAIRVFKCICVPPTFHARFSAVSRTYLYRFGVISEDKDFTHTEYKDYSSLIPLTEINRTHFVKGPFNMNMATEACQLLQGEKDFSAFTSVKRNYSPSAIRNLYQVQIAASQPLMNPVYDPAYIGIKFYNITFSANSFCFRQIRYMVPIIIAVGQGCSTLDFLELLLKNPNERYNDWPLTLVPAYGLYLINVEYMSESFDESSSEKS